MYDIRFSKVRNNHNKLRDDVIEGTTANLPEVGKRFLFFGEGKEFGIRQVNTSPVEHIEKMDNTYMLNTESGSVYKVEVLGVSRQE